MKKNGADLENLNSNVVVKKSPHDTSDLVEDLKREALTYAINQLRSGSYDSESSEEICTILSCVLQRLDYSNFHK